MNTCEDGDTKYYVIKGRYRKVYHIDPTCHKLRHSNKGFMETDDIDGLSPCYYCVPKTSSVNGHKLGRIASIEIPVWVTSDGQDFGSEINALRHELELCMSRIANLEKQLKQTKEHWED